MYLKAKKEFFIRIDTKITTLVFSVFGIQNLLSILLLFVSGSKGGTGDDKLLLVFSYLLKPLNC